MCICISYQNHYYNFFSSLNSKERNKTKTKQKKISRQSRSLLSLPSNKILACSVFFFTGLLVASIQLNTRRHTHTHTRMNQPLIDHKQRREGRNHFLFSCWSLKWKQQQAQFCVIFIHFTTYEFRGFQFSFSFFFVNKNSLFRKWNTDSGSGAGAGGDDDCSCPSMMGGFFFLFGRFMVPFITLFSRHVERYRQIE